MKSLSSISTAERKALGEELKIHKERARSARKELNDIETECKEDGKLLCFTFDLEKNQAIPFMNVSVAYYKRNMFLYNLIRYQHTP